MANASTTQSTRPQVPTRYSALRTIAALMLREMSTTYGRSALGYLWALLEPVAGILLLTLIFSFALRAPSVGTNFPLFYASGMLPFLLYMTISQKVSVSLRFSKALLFYPRVTYMDALLARTLVNGLTQVLISIIVISSIVFLYDLDLLLNHVALMHGYLMAIALGMGIGTLNCFLLSVYPIWESTWAILNRPLFLISCVFFIPETIPRPYQDWLMWNPLVHIIGTVRQGIYATYDARYVDPIYIYTISLVTMSVGLLLLRRYHKDITNNL